MIKEIEALRKEFNEKLDALLAEEKQPTFEVGQKVLVKIVPDGPYTVLKYYNGSDHGPRVFLDYKEQRLSPYGFWVYPSDCTVFQPLLSGPFDASRIPKDKIPGYMVWIEENHRERLKGDYVEVETGWHEITNESGNGGLEVGGAWFSRIDGAYSGCPSYATLHFQPPEQPKINAKPSDELLLQVIDEMPWVPEWCRNGRCENSVVNISCPHNRPSRCPGNESVCNKIFGTYQRCVGGNGCPCGVYGIDRIQSVKSRIIKLAEEHRTYKVGDCFEWEYGSSAHILVRSTGYDRVELAVISNDDGHWGHAAWKTTDGGVIKDSESFASFIKTNHLAYLGPFSEVFTRTGKSEG